MKATHSSPTPSESEKKNSKIIGITGNIACGKSSVAFILNEKGYAVVDADQISRNLMLPSTPAYQAILDAFGPSILFSDKTINRKFLRDFVFNDPMKRSDLEKIMHPAITKASNQEFKQLFSQGKQIVFYEASLLIETNRHKDLQGLIVVTCPLDLQLKRLMKRDGIDQKLAQQMIDAQMPQEQKAGHADWIIENNQDLEALKHKVDEVLLELGC